MRNLTRPQGSCFQGLKNSQGNTILGVLCLIAASVAAFQISYSESISVNSGVKNFRILSARDSLEFRIKSYSSMGATFRSSMHVSLPTTVNSELRNCVFGTGPTPCMANVKTPVALYYPVYTGAGTPSTAIRRISGAGMDDLAEAESAFYDSKGNLCLPNSTGSVDASCAFFEVRTSFIATCAAGAPSCATAENITVNYLIKGTTLAGSSSQKIGRVSMAAINLNAPEVSVSDILPAKPGSSSSNVTISLLTFESTISLETISSKLKELGMTDPKDIAAMALAFQQSGVTDLSKLEFAARVGQPDPAWIKLVADSGITNVQLAQELYWERKEWTPEKLAAVAGAVADIKIPEVAFAIAEKMITDKAVATEMANAVAAVANPDVAAGIIAGGHQTDAEKVQQISAAVSHIANPYAWYLAEAGVTDSSIANEIVAIVSAIENPYGTGWMIVGAKGDVEKIRKYVDQSLNSTSSSSNSGTPETTTTTSTPPPPAATPAAPVEISLMPTCSTCAPLTY